MRKGARERKREIEKERPREKMREGECNKTEREGELKRNKKNRIHRLLKK